MARQPPNIITLLNLFFGALSLLAVLQGDYMMGFWWLVAAAVADFLDGAVARVLGVSSPVGKELDSLADVISFGLVPGIMLWSMVHQDGSTPANILGHTDLLSWHALVLLYPLFAAYRLAKFNLDTRQATTFIGLPTPAAAIFILGLLLSYQYDFFGARAWLTQPALLIGISLLLGLLAISEIPMFSLKPAGKGWSGNEIKITFVLLSVLALFFFKGAALSLIIGLYILLNTGYFWATGKALA